MRRSAPTPCTSDVVAPPPPAPLQLRAHVSADVDALHALHCSTGWTPDPYAGHIRPDEESRAAKEFVLANLRETWVSLADWVCVHIFAVPKAARRSAGDGGGDGRQAAAGRPPSGAVVLHAPRFTYATPRGTEHLVFWAADAPPGAARLWDDASLGDAIAREVDARGGGEFVW
jgi:hypothetical protein